MVSDNLARKLRKYVSHKSSLASWYHNKKNTIFISIITIFVLPVIFAFIFTLIGIFLLLGVKHQVEHAQISQASLYASFAHHAFSVAKQSAYIADKEVLGQSIILRALEHVVQTGDNVSLLIVHGIAAYNNAVTVTTGKSSNNHKVLSTVIYELNTTIRSIKKIQEDKIVPSSVKTKINELHTLLSLIDTTSPNIPQILGMDRQKKYLLLFQNNMELRPGGGFIGSYAVVTIHKAKLMNLTFYDVYDADGQLTQHIEPPYPIRRYIPQVHWFMRDSNFDVDFTKSASSAAYFLSLAKGVSVDGVVGIDVSFLKNLIKAAGSVYVSDYNTTLTADNFFIVTEKLVEKNYFPGSTQKKDFLNAVYKTYQNLLTENKIDGFKFLRSINDSIVQKHILFLFTDSRIQNNFTANGWSASLWDNRTMSPFKINDFLGVNEANIGSTKVNYFIKRRVKQNVHISQTGKVAETVAITYTNLTKEWPGGGYKNYLRFILPKNAVLSQVSFDGVTQKTTPAITDFSIYESKNFIPPTELEVELSSQEGFPAGKQGKTIYGFLVEVPVGLSKTIEITYSFDPPISLALSSFVYDLIYFKQPGTEEYPFEFSLSYPPNYRVENLSSEFQNNNNQLTMEKMVNGDVSFKLDFKKK